MSGLDDSRWIAANSKKYFPLTCIYTNCSEEPTKQQKNEYLKVAVGAIDRYERPPNTHKHHDKVLAHKNDKSNNCASQSVFVDNPKGRIMTIVNFYHGRSGYDFSTINSMWDIIFKRHGLMRSILYFESRIEEYKKNISERGIGYVPPKSQNDDIHKVLYQVEEELKIEFALK